MAVTVVTGGSSFFNASIFEIEKFNPNGPIHFPKFVFEHGQKIICLKECGLEIGQDYIVSNVIGSSLGDLVELRGHEGKAFEVTNFA